MKKIKVVLIMLILVIIFLVISYIIYQKTNSLPENIYYVGSTSEKLNNEDAYVITSFNDFQNRFSHDQITADDFIKNNFVVVSLAHDSCSEKNLRLKEYKINGNDIELTVKYRQKCEVCNPTYLNYLIKVDKSISYANVNIKYIAKNNSKCN